MGTRVETANVDGNFIMRSKGEWGVMKNQSRTNLCSVGRREMLGMLAFQHVWVWQVDEISCGLRGQQNGPSRGRVVWTLVLRGLRATRREGSFIDSDRKYWQVTGIVNALAKAHAREPEQTRFLHGRFSWEKKTFAYSCHQMKGVFLGGGGCLSPEKNEKGASLPVVLTSRPANSKPVASGSRSRSMLMLSRCGRSWMLLGGGTSRGVGKNG